MSEYKEHVLTDRREFARLFRTGIRKSTRNVQLIFVPGKPEELRFAVCVSVRFGNSVKRNRLKRIFRAALMPYLLRIQKGWVIAVLPTGKTEGLTSTIVAEQLEDLLRSRGMLGGAHG
ncbi:Ribonuclease P protein component [Leptonema illini DSM 21528]|uniref:Ribonuclease P protein component n=1 Tax=Leptonema illini DSM 21528 TaxID=929563 RepID=H2CGM4_9LEPT|nr:ribonuclease P protein component [Leptonema illini]EHQ07941.1 Ribonuclease P protein component [Leptonema illini DSM 21528]